MVCPHCSYSEIITLKQRTTLGYERFRCRCCGRRFNERTGTPSDRVQQKRQVACAKSTQAAKQAITLYEDFSYLYRCVLAELNVFDRYGNLRDRQQAEEGIKVCLALIEQLKRNAITEAVNKVRRTLPDLFHYLDVAKKVVDEFKALPLPEECLKAYFIAWQWGKAVRKAKKSDRKNTAQ